MKRIFAHPDSRKDCYDAVRCCDCGKLQQRKTILEMSGCVSCGHHRYREPAIRVDRDGVVPILTFVERLRIRFRILP